MEAERRLVQETLFQETGEGLESPTLHKPGRGEGSQTALMYGGAGSAGWSADAGSRAKATLGHNGMGVPL